VIIATCLVCRYGYDDMRLTECVDAIEKLPEDILLLQKVQRDLGQRGAKLSARLRGPAQLPHLQQGHSTQYIREYMH